eukprot:m.63293 g.63293  ORF g.63293 m.63293 type:complete len:58 (-) comp11945_c0_seq1:589-762(-)
MQQTSSDSPLVHHTACVCNALCALPKAAQHSNITCIWERVHSGMNSNQIENFLLTLM